MTNTIPEKPRALSAQMKWLQDGKRKAVLITQGEHLPLIPFGCAALPTMVGLFIYDPARITGREIMLALAENRLGELLEYGIPAKPTKEVGAVVIRDGAGQEKQAVVTDAEHLQAVLGAANRMADPGDHVKLEPCEQVIEDRLRPSGEQTLVDTFPRLRPLKTQEELEQVRRVAQADGHSLAAPNFFMEKDGEVIGAAGVNSLPLCTVWFKQRTRARDTLAMINVLENSFRMAGSTIVATLCNDDSPFLPVMEKMGYMEMKGTRVYLRKL